MTTLPSEKKTKTRYFVRYDSRSVNVRNLVRAMSVPPNRMDPDKRIDQLGDAQLHAGTGECRGLVERPLFKFGDQGDHASRSEIGGLIERGGKGGSDPGIAGIDTGRGNAEVFAEDDLEIECGERSFDGRAADFAITLGGVTVTGGEKGAGNHDGKIQDGASDEFAAIHIPAAIAGSPGAGGFVRSAGGCEANGAGERADGEGCAERGVGGAATCGICVDFPIDEREFVGVQACGSVERGIAHALAGVRPTPWSGNDAMNSNFNRVTRHGIANGNGASQTWARKARFDPGTRRSG